MNTIKFTPPHPLHTAVLFLVFNRPEPTKEVFDAIKKAKPPRLYIAADGARGDKEGEDEKVSAVREYIMRHIDWECEVHTLFREQNLGCKMAVSSAIEWFFEHEEMGIILEDDCLPSQSFFWFCETLLLRYKDHEEIGAISGDLRGLDNQFTKDHSYDFTRYFSMWGWATWKRVWKDYRVDTFNTPNIQNKIQRVLMTMKMPKRTSKFWKNEFDNVRLDKIDTWDYQFIFLLFTHQYKTIIPSVNLVSNLGFGEDSTHTKNPDAYQANVARYDMTFPLTLKKDVVVNKTINTWYETHEYKALNLFDRIHRKIRKIAR